MKPLYWTKVLLPACPSMTLWEKLEDVEVPGPALEELFSKAVKKPKAVNEESTEVKEDVEKKVVKEKPTKVIDPKKGQNVGIFIRSNKLDVAAVEDMVYRLQYTGDLETLDTLRSYQATEEELAMLTAHVEVSPDKVLDLPDKFLLDLTRIQHTDSRLACLQFKVGFIDRVSEVEMRMANIRSCCSSLTSAPALRKLLAVVLAAGNYLNGGNKQRGQADGFALDILPKLKDLKTTSNTDNLLGFVVKFCIEKYDEKAGTGEAVLPVPEPGDLEKCRNVDFEVEKVTCAALSKEVQEVRKRVEAITAKAAEEIKEPFCSLMNEFLELADREASKIMKEVEACASQFIDAIKMFKFVPKKGKVEDAKPEEFFSIWYSFAGDYKNIWKREQVGWITSNISKSLNSSSRQLRIEKELVKAARLAEKTRKSSISLHNIEVGQLSGVGLTRLLQGSLSCRSD